MPLEAPVISSRDLFRVVESCLTDDSSSVPLDFVSLAFFRSFALPGDFPPIMESFWEWIMPCEMKLSWAQRLAVYLVEHIPSPVIWLVLLAGVWKVAIWCCSSLLCVTRRPRVNFVRHLARGVLRSIDTRLHSWRFPLVLSAKLRSSPQTVAANAPSRRRGSVATSGGPPPGSPKGALAFYESTLWTEPRTPAIPL